MPAEMHRRTLSASTEMHRHTNKAVPVGGTGITGPKQMWQRACPRCAARAALDFSVTIKLNAGTPKPITTSSQAPEPSPKPNLSPLSASGHAADPVTAL